MSYTPQMIPPYSLAVAFYLFFRASDRCRVLLAYVQTGTDDRRFILAYRIILWDQAYSVGILPKSQYCSKEIRKQFYSMRR